MNIIGWLRKLGILRYGTKSYKYTSGKDMPAEALMDDVYDAKKDLTTNSQDKKNEKKKGSGMWKKILGGFVTIIVLIIGITMYATSGMTEAVNEFFIHVKTKHYNDAYDLLSDDFKQSTSKNEFKAFLIQNSLTEYKNASWDSRSFENNMGKLEGTVTTKSGDSIPLTIQFIKNQDVWKIFSITKQMAGVQQVQNTKVETEKEAETNIKSNKSTPQLPSKDKLISLTQENTQIFAQAVNAKNMSVFYDQISSFWQKDTTPEALDKAFDAFYKAGIDFTVLKNITPTLNKEPTLLKDGRLLTEGHYPTSPSVVYFNYSYINENNHWKLVGFNINVK